MKRPVPVPQWLHPDYLWAHIIAADPGLVRLRLAARATTTAVVATLCLASVSRVVGQPVLSSLIGVVIAMMSSVFVNDRTPRAQFVTLVLLPLPAIAALISAAAVAQYTIISEGIFVAIIVVAVAVRRYGERGLALGMVSFLSYLFALFFRARLPQVPWMVVSLVIGLGCAAFVRFVVFPDRPATLLRHSEGALLAQVRILLWQLLNAIAGARNHAALDDALVRLNEIALTIDQTTETTPIKEDGDALRRRTFDVELHAERAAMIVRRLLADGIPEDLRDAMSRALHATVCALGRAEGIGNTVLAPLDAASSAGAGRVQRLADSLRRLLATAWRLQHRVPEPVCHEQPVAPTTPCPVPRPGLHPATQQAIQAGLAGALAMIAGHRLSHSRWYWAVIAAFVIFTRTESRGHTVLRSWQRMLGTVVGIVAGLLVARVVIGHRLLEVGLMLPAVFAGFYMIRASYTVMIAAITIVLALLYSMLGLPTTPVLLVRLEETLVGVAIGAAVAMVVLPTGTRPHVERQMLAVLRALSSELRLIAKRLAGGGTDRALLHGARDADAAARALRTAAQPLMARITPVDWSDGARQVLFLSVLAYYVRNLASLASGIENGRDAALIACVQTVLAETADDLDRLAAAIEARVPPSPLTGPPAVDAVCGARRAAGASSGHMACLEVVRAMHRVVQGLHASLTDSTADDDRPGS